MYNDIAERRERATKYIAEKEFKRQQVAESRREFVIVATGALLVASIIGALLG